MSFQLVKGVWVACTFSEFENRANPDGLKYVNTNENTEDLFFIVIYDMLSLNRNSGGMVLLALNYPHQTD